MLRRAEMLATKHWEGGGSHNDRLRNDTVRPWAARLTRAIRRWQSFANRSRRGKLAKYLLSFFSAANSAHNTEGMQ